MNMSNLGNPLTPAQWEALNRLVEGVTPEQLVWINGYWAGFSAARQQPVSVESPQPPKIQAKPEITVLFGSQTGNAEKLALLLHSRLVDHGFLARVEGMGSYKTAQIKRDRHLLIVVSTYGEGDPPDNALAFHEFLFGKKAPKLDGTQFSVLALGDSSYEHFCKTGREIDERLAELGASRLLSRMDCDVDYEDTAATWIDTVLTKLHPANDAQTDSVLKTESVLVGTYSKKNPYHAKLLENIRLTGRGSSKDVRHIELSIADSGLVYEPGDSLGIVARNWPQRVNELLESLKLNGSATVLGANGIETSLEQAFSNDFEITTLTRPFLEKYAELSGRRQALQH